MRWCAFLLIVGMLQAIIIKAMRLTPVSGSRLGRNALRNMPPFSSSAGAGVEGEGGGGGGGKKEDLATGDVLITGLNGAQDIMVKVVSCREIIQEAILRNDLTPQSSKALGEVMVCALMMGAGLKGEETLQVNLVGDKQDGIKNIMAITDGDLKIRGMVGVPRFYNAIASASEKLRTRDLLGEGQVQIVRNHPSWNTPSVGIVALRDTDLSLNLALYMAESEQRSAVLLTDVRIDGNLCRHALGIMMERLPGATDENIELSIRNLGEVEKLGLRSYLDRTEEERKADQGMFRDFTPSLDKILDDCMVNMNDNELRWSKTPRFRCSCGIDKVWRTLRLLPLDEVKYINENENGIEMKCEFCGEKYALTKAQIEKEIFDRAAK